MTKYLQILLVFVATLGSYSTIAQQDSTRSWQEIIAQPVVNYAEAKKAFETQWKDNLERKGYKQFRRWEQFVRPLLDENGVYDANKIFEIKREAIRQREERKKQSRTAQRANWKLLGPAAPPAPANFNNESVGRIDCIGFHPTDANTFYVGSPTGGLWKTTDGGKNWAFLSQSWVELGVSDIAIDPINPNVVYVATGDRDSQDTYCYGILKSLDGGMTWNSASTGLPYIPVICRLLIHPTQPNVLLVSSSHLGIWKTTNGGGQWTQCTGVPNTELIYDMEFKPNDPQTVYAVSSGKLFKSSNLGDTFSQVMGLPFSATDAPKSLRMALAVTPAAPEKVFIANAAIVGNAYVVEGVYRSDDTGNSFTKIASSSTKISGTTNTFANYSSQAWFTWSLGVSPSNANEILFGDVGLFKTSDGGITWSDILSVSNIHVDIHAIEYQPKTNRLYVGSDGGIKRAPMDNTTRFENLNYGISNLQAYHVGGLPNNNDVAYIGCQDNWVMKYDKGTWRIMRLVGDGGETVIDPTNPNVAYACRQLGQISKTTDGGATWTTITPNPRPPGLWMIPLVMNPANSQELLAGYDQVYKTTDGGASWQIVGSLPAKSYVYSIQYAPSNPQIIYIEVIYNYEYIHKIYKSSNGGATWVELPLNSREYVGKLLIHPTNPQKLWINIGNNIMTSNDGGQTLINYQGTTPLKVLLKGNTPLGLELNKMVYQLGTNDGIYLATNLGVYYRDATMSAWQSFDDDLPNVSVTDLEISYQNGGKIRASTYGRGLWESNLYDNAPCNIPPTPIVGTFKESCAEGVLSLPSIKGDNLKYYAEATGNTTIAAPTSTAVPARFYVSQTVNGCESMRLEVKLLLEKSKSPVLSTSTVSYCTGAAATPLAATGSNLKWYTAETGGSATASVTPPTNTATTLRYYVSQTETGKCESNREKVEIVVKAISALPTLSASSVNYCVGAMASPLAATGNELKWYTSETGGQAVSNITPPTSTAAKFTYFVSQTETGKCEGGRAKIEVIVRANSAPPTVSAPSVNYCIGTTAKPLIATGNSLKWYTAETGGQAENSITPPTNAVATLAYFVSQTETDKCESGRVKLEVVIKPKPTGVLSGSKTIFQYDSTQIQVALTGEAPWSIVLDNQTKLQAQNTPAIFFVKPLQTTTYRLASVENACGVGTVSGEAVITVTPVLSVSPNQNDEIQVFPNPTAGDLTIKAKVVSNAAYDIELIDATGRVLIKQTNTWLNSGNEVKLATSQLAAGTYLLRVVGKQKNYVWKVAKQ